MGARVSAGSVTGAVALSEGMPADTGFWLRDLQWAAEERWGGATDLCGFGRHDFSCARQNPGGTTLGLGKRPGPLPGP